MEPNDQAIEGPDAEAAYGGADAVDKTTYVIGAGTDPQARQYAEVSARTGPGGGLIMLAWITALVSALVLVTYLPGIAS
jgi:hypothetical protein